MLLKAAVRQAGSSLLSLSLLSSSLLILSLPAAAVDTKKIATDTLVIPTRSSTSISLLPSSDLNKIDRDEKLKNADTSIMPALIKEGNRIESIDTSVEPSLKIFNVTTTSHDFTLFDASTDLISDFNYDGFYHRFSVTFDVDTVYDKAYVYAKVYLSYEGGPWNHYATSDDYPVYLDSENDTMTIETELDDGFAPGYYDVRIELYDADYNEWLLSYGPYDDASLRALPLEDSYYDDPGYIGDSHLTTEVIVSARGHGAMGWLLIFIPALLVVARTIRRKF